MTAGRRTLHMMAGGVETLRGSTIRRDAGLYGFERALARRGLWPVAGADEAGRGACAGPLVVGAVVLPEGKRGQVPGLADSKLLTPAARERVYAQVVRRALSWTAVVIRNPPPSERGSSSTISPASLESK